MKNVTLGLLLLCCLLAGCGELRGERVVSGAAQGDPVVEMPDAVRGATEVRNVHGNQAFAFAATELLTRRVMNGADLVEGGPVVMSFLVPQCSVCIAAGPDLVASAADNPDITYVFVHSGGNEEQYRDFLDEIGAGGPRAEGSNVIHIDDSPGLLWARFGVIQQPTNVFVGADGSVTQSLGALSPAHLDEVANRVVAH